MAPKPRLHAVESTPERVTEAATADAKSAAAGLGDAAGAARRETAAELAAELRQVRHEEGLVRRLCSAPGTTSL